MFQLVGHYYSRYTGQTIRVVPAGVLFEVSGEGFVPFTAGGAYVAGIIGYHKYEKIEGRPMRPELSLGV